MPIIGILELNGFIKESYCNLTEEDIKFLYFLCPNENHGHIIILPITQNETKVGKKSTAKIDSFIWKFDFIKEKQISVSPSIEIPNDIHIGFPTYFNLVDKFEDLYIKSINENKKEGRQNAIR